MKTFVNRIAVFAAGAVVFGTMAYGQQMTADIPFAFNVSGKTMPAGSYTLVDTSGSGTHVTSIRNSAARTSVLAVSSAVDSNATGTASLQFACRTTGCALTAVKTPDGTRNYYPSWKLSRHERATLSMVDVPARFPHAE